MTQSHRPLPEIAGAWWFSAPPAKDDRGFFCRTMDRQWLEAAGIDPDGFAQDSVSRSRRGVVRGLHLRRGRGEAKLVRCSRGRIFDVLVDLRPDSPTFLSVLTVGLDADQPASIYIPAGCAHGFQSLTEHAELSYRIDRPHDPAEDVTINAFDPALGVPWPMPATLRSLRDRTAPALSDVMTMLGASR